MTKRTGPSNPVLKELIVDLRIKANDQKSAIWKRVADDLERSTRSRRIVNLAKLNRYTKENETVVVPGKVLGGGALEHKINIAAFKFSESAKKKLESNGSTIISLNEISKTSPKGKSIRIIG
jgi:large subunit ribosomal protein L18e